MNIVVIGGGIIGTCIAWRLGQRGHAVTVYDDDFSQGFDRSSAGRSRIVRRTYPDPFYTDIMSEAYPMWHEVEHRSNLKLLHEVGLLYFGSESNVSLSEAAESMENSKVAFKEVKGVDAGPRLLSGERGLLIDEGGWVEADSALVAVRGMAEASGAVWRDQEGGHSEVQKADRYVLCPGPRILDWVPNLDVTVTKQSYLYHAVREPIRGPVWIHDCGNLFYGFPSEAGQNSFKIGFHAPGPAADPHDKPLAADSAQVTAMLAEASDRFEGLGETWSAHSCLYTSTPDEDFRVGHHGEKGLFISACSGHAFKMGPWLGKLMADLIEEKQDLRAWPRFAFPRV